MPTSSLQINRDIILAAKRQITAERRHSTPLEAVRALAAQQRRPRYMLERIRAENRVAIMGQVRRTPTYDPVTTALQFVSEGADAIAFFTDHTIYEDDLNDMLLVARGVSQTPVISMNYVLDGEYGVLSTRAADASGLVLYAALLDETLLRRALSLSQRWKMMTFLQSSQADELIQFANTLSPHMVCVGDLLDEDLERHLRMLAYVRPQLPLHTQVMLTTCLHTLDAVETAILAGVDAVLVDGDLLRKPKQAAQLRQLVLDIPHTTP